MRTFNTEGPCNPSKHYMIDALRGLGDDLSALIENNKYFIIHAARQSGKTTLLRALASGICAGGGYRALYCSLETLEGVDEAAIGIPAIVDAVKNALVNYSFPDASSFAAATDLGAPYSALQNSLVAYCRTLDKPLVLLFDEADCLSGATLIAFLRQLRSGYINRDDVPFAHSVALAGMRNIRDYSEEYRKPLSTLGSASPFNIVAETMTLKNFTKEEIAGLYAQHTTETGREFTGGAINMVWEQTQGQPWLVNAIAKLAAGKKDGCETPAPVSVDMVSEAIHELTLRKDSHFDSLATRLREERVRSIIEPILIGKESAISRNSDDFSYVMDLGLIREEFGRVEPANPIYGDAIVRTLSRDVREEIDGGRYGIPRYIKNSKLDMDYLLCDFQIFWRENEAIWRNKKDYQEAAPHLVLHAFLQRVVNGGGSISREMAAAAGRVDICVTYGERRYPIELKIRRDATTYGKGVEQIFGYMDKLGCADGWLIIFDQSGTTPWDEKLFIKKEIRRHKTVTVYGC